MNIDKIHKLAEKVMAGLNEAEMGELIFMHHVIMKTIDVIRDRDEPDALQICDTLEQAIFNEISRRMSSGKISFTDPDVLQEQIMRYYTDSEKNSPIAKELRSELLDSFIDEAKLGKNKSKGKIASEGREFVKRYEKAFNLKKKLVVPSPDEIINGKSPPDLPNN